jgi:hypothetical protein
VFGPVVRNFMIKKSRVAAMSEEEFHKKEEP